MSREIMHNYVLEVDGVRHKLVKHPTGFCCIKCSLRFLCDEQFGGAPCVSITGKDNYRFVREGGKDEQKDKD